MIEQYGSSLTDLISFVDDAAARTDMGERVEVRFFNVRRPMSPQTIDSLARK